MKTASADAINSYN